MGVNMDKKKIERINALSKKQRSEGLDEAEKKEQAKLRAEYLQMIRANFRAQLENIEMVD